MNIEEKIIKELRDRNQTLTTAESCTGGLLAGRILNVSGASYVYNEGHITYSNEAKERLLGVKHSTLQQYGAVSKETAAEMAKGAALAANAEAALCTTGIAGPTGGTKNKPVGMVCFGFYIDGKSFSSTKYFGDLGRNIVRDKSVEYVMLELIKELG